MKVCCYCGHEAENRASSCPDCGTAEFKFPVPPALKLDPGPAPPQLADSYLAWSTGRLLVVHTREAVLPDRCVKCNQPAAGRRLRLRVGCSPPGTWAIPLLALMAQKEATVNVGLCRRHSVRRQFAAIGAAISPVGGFCVIIAAVLRGTPWVILLGLAILFAGPIVGFVASRVVTATKIDDDYVWLSGAAPAYLGMLPQVPTRQSKRILAGCGGEAEFLSLRPEEDIPS